MNIEQKQPSQFQDIAKIFVFEKQYTHEQEIINCIIRTDKKFAPILHIIQKIANPSLWRIKIYDNEASRFVDLNNIANGPQYVIPYKYIQLDYTLFTYSQRKNVFDISATSLFSKNTTLITPSSQSQMESENSKGSESGLNDKKQRNKQKTVGQVIELVKRWRNIHNSMNGKNKISLYDAAKIIGIPKKTLDDYYYYLRIGELKEFDFNENMHEKIGVLRKFVRDNEDKRGKRHYLKHPRNLLMLQGDLINSEDRNSRVQEQQISSQEKETNKIENEIPSSSNIEDHFNNMLDYSLDNFKSYQDNFFGEVQQKISQPNDPFFNFTNSFLKKKDAFQFDLFFD